MASLGYRNSRSEKWEPLAGYARGWMGTTDTDLLTAGTALKRRNNEFIVGAFYLATHAKVSNSSSFNSYGVMFSSNVEY